MGVEAYFECPSCGHEMRKQSALIPTTGGYKFLSPDHCGCGRKSGFKILTLKFIDLVNGEALDKIYGLLDEKDKLLKKAQRGAKNGRTTKKSGKEEKTDRTKVKAKS